MSARRKLGVSEASASAAPTRSLRSGKELAGNPPETPKAKSRRPAAAAAAPVSVRAKPVAAKKRVVPLPRPQESSEEESLDEGEEDDETESALQRAALADSIAVAVQARIAAMPPSVRRDEPLRHQASSAELAPPPWPGKLNLKSDPSKLTVWLASRTRYLEVCRLSGHAPRPLNVVGTFDPFEVPTLRRWLGMVEGTSLCDDWVALSPDLEAKIIPTLKERMKSISEETLRAELVALRIPPFSSSWSDLASSFDQYAARWTVIVFEAKRAGVELSSPDLADIMKAHCVAVDALKLVLAGRFDDVVVLRSKVFQFLEQEDRLSIRIGASTSQRPPVDTRKGGATVAFTTPNKTQWVSPSSSSTPLTEGSSAARSALPCRASVSSTRP